MRAVYRIPCTDTTFVVLRRAGSLVRTRHLSGPREGQRITHTAAFVAHCEVL